MKFSNRRKSRNQKYEQKPPSTFLGVVLLKSEQDERAAQGRARIVRPLQQKVMLFFKLLF